MLFNSLPFLIFLPVVVLLFWLLPHRFRWIMLLLASYYFYMSWNPSLVFLIAGTTLISYLSGFIIEKSKKRSVRLSVLIFCLVVSLGVLFFYKYFNFFSESVTALLRAFSLPVGEFTLNLILPVGISFYTFQTLSYTIDIYRGNIKAEKHLGYYALFVSFFPQLVAGPIERPENLLPQLREKRNFSARSFDDGLKYILVGFVKKIVIADTLAYFVNNIYNDPSHFNGLTVLIATLLFAVQILCDFDGYTNIAIGCAKLMNIKLMQNFNNPYGATGIKDFWSKWHISLSGWLRDYVYIPLGGSRCSQPRHMLNLLITFLLSGLWHGANVTFIVWGAMHGLYQIFGILTGNIRKKINRAMGVSESGYGLRVRKMIVTFLLVDFAWIFFRANSIGDAGAIVSALFTQWEFSASFVSESFAMLGMTAESLMFVGVAIAALFFMSKIFIDRNPLSEALLPARAERDASTISVKNIMYFLLLASVVLAWIFTTSAVGYENAFIYFQF